MCFKKYYAAAVPVLALIAAAIMLLCFTVRSSAASVLDSAEKLKPGVCVDAVNSSGAAVKFYYELYLKNESKLVFSSDAFSKKAEYRIITSAKKIKQSGNLSGLIDKPVTLKKGTYYLELKLKKSQYAKGLFYTVKAGTGNSKTVTFGGSTYSADAKELVINCCNADKEEYEQLLRCTKVERLEIQVLRDLSYLKNMKSLKYLRIWNPSCVMLKNEGVLSGFTGLERLELLQTGISDLNSISGLKKLKYLQLYNENFVDDFSPLRSLKELREISLYGFNVSDISFMSSLDKLEVLALNDTDVHDLSPLYGSKSLREINIWGMEDKLNIDNAIYVLGSISSLGYVEIDDEKPFGAALKNALPDCVVGDLFLLGF